MSARDDASTGVDRLLVGGRIVDVAARRLVRADIGIRGDRIAWVGDVDAAGAPVARETIDVADRVLAPGLIDSHMHIESTMLTPRAFAAAAVRHGTTSVFVDPHEITNVCGRAGVDLFLDEAADAAIDIWIGVPSCVPATNLEDAGAVLDLGEIAELLEHPRVYGLAEMMNFPGVIEGIGDARAKVDLAVAAGLVVDGHAPGVSGEALRRYVTNGREDGVVRIESDHECTTAAEAIEKHAAGVQVAIRYGSASRDLERIVPGLYARFGAALDGFMLCSDDVDPIELEAEGHVDRIVRRTRDLLVEAGCDAEAAAIEAIRLATYEPGRFFSRAIVTKGRPRIGEIAPGCKADLVVFDGLESLRVDRVVRNGGLAAGGAAHARDDRSRTDLAPYTGTVRLARSIDPEDFAIRVETVQPTVDVRVIGAAAGTLITESLVRTMNIRDGALHAAPEEDRAKLAVFERHRASGSRGLGFVEGLGIRRGAVASTIAHDSHNLIVAGVDDASMAAAANRLSQTGGGLAVVIDGMATDLALPVAGLMSDADLASVSRGLTAILEAARATGSVLESPFMTLSFLALPVIPALKLTNRGLVDVVHFEPVPLVVG